MIESQFAQHSLGEAETLFCLANGYVGMRGSLEEGRPARSPGTFINGFHETWPILHAEPAFGLAQTGQTIVNVPDTSMIGLYFDDEPLYLPTARMPDYRRVLDMRNGVLTRELTWSSGSGKHVHVRSRRLVSLEDRHVIAYEYEVTPLDHAGPIVIASRLTKRQDQLPGSSGRGDDPRLGKVFSHPILQCSTRRDERLRMLFGFRTSHSGMTLGVGVDHVVNGELPYEAAITSSDEGGKLLISVDGAVGIPITVTKFATYHTSRSVPPEEVVDRCHRTLDRVIRGGFDRLQVQQREHLDRFWDRADVRVDCETAPAQTQQAIRWNLFQLLQATWCAYGAGVPAKGLTSQAYDGHYFWDSEIYVLPFLAYTQPRLARNLLRFRYSMLDGARERARQLSQRGAEFPWRTINGQEASANYQAGTAQYHINADIAFAMRHYTDIRGDSRFAAELSAEVLVETARFWEDLGFYGDDGRFHIHGVTGPDEYTTVVNDNTYTNLMARENLRAAASTVDWLQQDRPLDYAALSEAVDLHPDESPAWTAAAAAMYVPYDASRGIHPQDHAFLDREVWDLAGTPEDQFPLLLHFHPLVIYRFQVIKQADIVLAMFLLGEEFSAEQKRRNFEYYDALTTGDSSLSACVQSIVAAEVGLADEAMQYFRYALFMDLGNVAGNSTDGVHIASAAGVWAALVNGFGGVRDYGGQLVFAPRLPDSWRSLDFSLRFHDRQLRVHLTHDEEHFVLEEGDRLRVEIRGREYQLTPGQKTVVIP